MENTHELLELANQIFELEKKVNSKTDEGLFKRNFSRIQSLFSFQNLRLFQQLVPNIQ